MQLYVSEFSPYARMTRILLREKKLQPRVEEVLARTREKNSPYYDINASGRIPYLLRPDGAGLEGSRLILEYLDQLDDTPLLKPSGQSEYWEYARLEEAARSLMDGVSVWTRELKRPVSDRSQSLIDHEKARAARMIAKWDSDIDHPIMREPLNNSQLTYPQLNYPQLTLACALLLDQWNLDFEWRSEHPKLAEWLKPFAARTSFSTTEPPATISQE